MEWENNKLDFSHCSRFMTGPSERDGAVTNQQTGSHYGFSPSAEFVFLRLFLQRKPGRRWKAPSLQWLSAVPGNKVWRASEEQRAQRSGTRFKASEKWALRVKKRMPAVPLEAVNPPTCAAGILPSIPSVERAHFGSCPWCWNEDGSREQRGSRFFVPVLISHFVLCSHGRSAPSAWLSWVLFPHGVIVKFSVCRGGSRCRVSQWIPNTAGCGSCF